MASFFYLESISHSIQNIPFHLLEEDHQFSANPSSLPIEQGNNTVVDNLANLPKTINFTIRITNGITFTGENKVRKFLFQMEDIFRKKLPVSIVLTYAAYPNAFITNMAAASDEKSEYADFRITASINDYLNIDTEGNATLDTSVIRDPIAVPSKNTGGGG